MLDGRPRACGIRLPENTAPGRYRLCPGVYDPAQAGMPRLELPDGLDAAEIVFALD